MAKVEFHFGELFPRAGFIVTNLETDSRAVVISLPGERIVEWRSPLKGRNRAALPLMPLNIQQVLPKHRRRLFQRISFGFFEVVMTRTTPINPFLPLKVVECHLPAFWDAEDENPDVLVS